MKTSNSTYHTSAAKTLLLLAAVVCLAAGCSTQKNTGATRFWHAFNARYNTYYNGTLAYIDASVEKENGNHDNFTERLPLYTVGNKTSRELGKANYDIAITKAEKTIQLHSIKKKPEWTKSRRKTEADVEWLSRKEYNPFLWRAWMLMGRSQFYKGEFDEAAATFSYMSRLYKTQPAIYGKARAWLAKCYVESGWHYDAEDVIRAMRRDSIDWRAQKEWDYTLCDYYLATEQLDSAAAYLHKVVRHEMRSKQRAREYYILGQVEARRGNTAAAYQAYRKAIRQNPPYELEFNARIAMTEVAAAGAQSKKMVSRLRRMAYDDNNKEYHDQIYYAIGNIHLAAGDTLQALAAYERGAREATRAGIEKGVLLLRLGDLYWQRESYSDAQRCYAEAIGLLDKDRPDYEQLSDRSKRLDELVPYTDAVHMQDSLLALAAMPEAERNKAIDRQINALKAKEKAEARDKAEEEAEKKRQQTGPTMNSPFGQRGQATTGARSLAPATAGSTWYFYSPLAVTQGKQTFQRVWGRRENKDDWRRANRTVVADEPAAKTDTIAEREWTPEQLDSIAAVEEKAEKERDRMDSTVNDPHHRDYYLAQIPFTPEQQAESHKTLRESLLQSAIIFKDKFDNLTLSRRAFERLEREYPDAEPRDEVLYHLFLLYSRLGQTDRATAYVEKMKQECPDSRLTILVTDPYFADNARYGTHIEDSLYAATYDAFRADRTAKVLANEQVSATRFPLGANRDRFIFLGGMAQLSLGQTDSCLAAMTRVVDDYPDSPVQPIAGMLINGVRAGRTLHGTHFDIAGVWDRRGAVLAEADSLTARKFKAEPDADHMVVLAYAPDSLNENTLLFQLARFNFTSFLVRNFDITITDHEGLHHMAVSGFRSHDEARLYARLLMAQEPVRRAAGGARVLVITPANLELIGRSASYNDYDAFYARHYAALPVAAPERLYESGPAPTGKRDADTAPLPALPDDTVAPGGAKPIDPNAEADDAADAINVDTPPIEIEETPAIEVEQAPAIEVEQAPAVEVEQAPAIEVEQAPAVEVEQAPAAPAVSEVDVHDETPSKPQQSENEITIEAPTPETAPSEDEIIIDDDKPAAPQGEDIIIEDTKPSADALEDEYLELDGF